MIANYKEVVLYQLAIKSVPVECRVHVCVDAT